MALNATFEANFSAFNQAVDESAAKLRDFDDDVNALDRSLGGMGLEGPSQLQAFTDATKGASAATAELGTESQTASVSFGTLVASYVTAEVAIQALTKAYT